MSDKFLHDDHAEAHAEASRFAANRAAHTLARAYDRRERAMDRFIEARTPGETQEARRELLAADDELAASLVAYREVVGGEGP